MGLFHQFMLKNSKSELIKAFAERATELKLTADKINKQIVNPQIVNSPHC
jgi:hypothetical protein